MVGKRQAADGDGRHAAAQVDGLEGGLLQAGALAAQGVADQIGQFLEHGGLSPERDVG